jgi:hypothetical protein
LYITARTLRNSGWNIERPIVALRTRHDRASVATAHGDDDVGGLDGVSGELLGELVGKVDADLVHDLADGRVDLVGGLRAGGG